MRAVNLVPNDLRRAGVGAGSGSGVGSYILLGVLALAVVVAGVWASSVKTVNDRTAEVARLNDEAAAAESQAAGLGGYQATVKAATARRTEVDALLDQRVDWGARLKDVSRTVPGGVWLTAMTATTAPGVGVAGGTSNPLRASVQAPAIEVSGCTTSQEAVAALMSRLRSMKGVTKVGLASSEKSDSGASSGGDSATGGAGQDCTATSNQRPKFQIVVFYGDGSTPAATPGTTTTASTTTTTGTSK